MADGKPYAIKDISSILFFLKCYESASIKSPQLKEKERESLETKLSPHELTSISIA